MLRRIISKTAKNFIFMREIQIGNNKLNVPVVETKPMDAPRSRDIQYVYKEIKNESVIRNFCDVKLNPVNLHLDYKYFECDINHYNNEYNDSRPF